MTNLQVVHGVDPAEWNDDVIRLNGCCFHSYDWSLFGAKRNNTTPLYFRWYDDSADPRSLTFGLLETKSLAGMPAYKTLSFGSLPATVDKSALQSMVDEIISYSNKNHIVSLGMHSFGTPFNTDIFRELGFSVAKRWEFLLDINTGQEELWKRLHGKKRNLIRKGQEAGLRIERRTDIEHVVELRKLALETHSRKKKQGIPFPAVGLESHYVLMKEKLIDAGIGRLYLAYDGDDPVAGAFFVGFNKTAYYMLSSANEQGLKKGAPDLILWTCITDYQREGYKMFNLGGVSEQDLNGQPVEKSGLYHFKKRFSAEPHLCYEGTLILRPTTHKIYNFLKRTKYRLSSRSCLNNRNH